MKLSHSIAILSVLGMIMSCSQSIEQDIIDNSSRELAISAVVDQTKTINNGDNTISWVEGDQMTLLYTQKNDAYGNSTYTRASGDVFKGSVSKLRDDANDFYAVYPKKENATTPKNVTYTFPASQTQAGNNSQAHISGENLPLYGIHTDCPKGTDPVLLMHHTAAVVNFVITNKEASAIKINQIKFTAPYDIAGTFSTDLTAEDIAWTAGESVKTVSLAVTDGAEIEPDAAGEFFVTMLPFNGEGEYKFEVIATDAEGKLIVSEKTATKNLDILGGAYSTINYPFVKTGDAKIPAYVKVTSEPQSWDGVYLVVDENSKKAFAIGKDGNKVDVSIEDNKILATEDLTQYALTVTDAGVKHANNSSLEAYNVRNSQGKYIYYSSDAIQIDDDNKKYNEYKGKDVTYYHTFRYADAGVEMISSGNESGFSKYYLGYSSSAFGYEKSEDDNRVQLYKYSEISPTPVDPPTTTDKTYTKATKLEAGKAYVIVYDNGTALKVSSGKVESYSVNGKISGSKLTIPADDVSSVEWTTSAASSSDSSAGDFYFENGGKVFGREGTGKNDIILTSKGTRSVWSLDSSANDLVQKSTSSSSTKLYLKYDSVWTSVTNTENNSIAVYVADSSSPTPVDPPTTTEKTYTKATSIAAGKTYVIVSNNQALKNNSGTAAAYSVSGKVSGTTLTIPAEDVSSIEWTSAAASSDFSGYGDFTFTNSGVMPGRTGSQNDDIIFKSAEDARSVWTLDSDGKNLSQKNSSKTVSLYWQYSDNKWNAKSQSATDAITIYVADSSSPTPVDPTPTGTTFNLENSGLKGFLDDAGSKYTNSNATTSVISTYSASTSSSNRLDTPAPVKLNWTGNATSISIYEGTSTTGTPVKTLDFSSSTSANIYNLIPGKTYSYKLNNTSTTTGTFKTEGRRRMIRVSDNADYRYANNCRDFGGIPTKNGDLKYGLIFRGTNMDNVGTAEKAVLVDELGIKLDVDLRAEGERKSSSPLGSGVSITKEGYQAYVSDLTNKTKMAATLTSILTYVSQEKPVYIHCRIGADRTGYVCMLLEALLGASIKECDIDYEMTSFAKHVISGNRTRNSDLNKDFRNNFLKSPYNADTIPEAVEDYVVNTLKIDASLVESFRTAMGVGSAE